MKEFTPEISTTRLARRWAREAAWGLLLLGVWVAAFWQLASAWRAYPTYQYGFAVPGAALYLAWRRGSVGGGFASVAEPVAGRWLALASVIAWLSFVLGELLRQIQPQSRLVGWLLLLAATVLTAATLLRLGGWPGLRRFAFPLGFTWLAAQWPVAAESFVTLKLKAMVTTVTAGLLNTTGVFALQRGNVLELTGGTVGVETACSGITSLQSSLMLALFLGELRRLSGRRRVGLAAAALGIAMAANCLRVYAISALVNSGGEAAAERYHDWLGGGETVFIIAAIVLLAFRFAPGKSAEGQEAPGGLDWWPGQAKLGAGGWAVVLAFAVAPFLTTGWFSLLRGAPVLAAEPLWVVRSAALAPWRSRPVALTPAQRGILGFSTGEALALARPAGPECTLYHFFWHADNPTVGPYLHTPDLCMSQSGWTQRGDPEPAELQVGTTAFPTRLYRFSRDGHEMAALETVWYGGAAANDLTRLGMLWKSPRGGMEVLELFVPGTGETAVVLPEAEAALGQVVSARRGQ